MSIRTRRDFLRITTIAAWPCDHFAMDNDFTGKKVIPFCASASSGLGQSSELLADAAGAGDWQNGERFSSGTSEDEARTYAAGIRSALCFSG